MPADKLENLLNASQNTELADVVARARDMGTLAQKLAASLPADYADGLVAANVRPDGELVVIARSPAWAARLRYEGDTLRAAAIAAGQQVGQVSVRVSHDT
jgi:hypothetical protein